MPEMHYDHEQAERDYYDIQNARKYRGCLTGFKTFLVLLTITMLALFFFSGCASTQPPATSSVGIVISVDGDRVLVSFEVMNEKRGSQASNWFYVPRHTYQKGDRYPDARKDPNLRP